jgi:hypothetical protein
VQFICLSGSKLTVEPTKSPGYCMQLKDNTKVRYFVLFNVWLEVAVVILFGRCVESWRTLGLELRVDAFQLWGIFYLGYRIWGSPIDMFIHSEDDCLSQLRYGDHLSKWGVCS